MPGFLYKRSYQISGGGSLKVGKAGYIRANVMYSQIANEGIGSRLQFTDQIDPDRGFVMPTYLSDVHIRYDARFVNCSVGYTRELKFSEMALVRMGAGVTYAGLLNSLYEITAGTAASNNFFSRKDLSGADGFNMMVPVLDVALNWREGMWTPWWWNFIFQPTGNLGNSNTRSFNSGEGFDRFSALGIGISYCWTKM